LGFADLSFIVFFGVHFFVIKLGNTWQQQITHSHSSASVF